MKEKIIIILGEPNSISSEIFLKSLNYIKNIKLNFIIIGNYSLLERQANYLNSKINTNFNLSKIDNLKNLIIIEIGWEKLIRKIYENRVNINLSEINEEIKKASKNSEDGEKIKNQIISLEINKVLNKYATSHLEKSKKKYLIKFL